MLRKSGKPLLEGSCANMRRGTNNVRGPSFALNGRDRPLGKLLRRGCNHPRFATAIPHFHPSGTSFGISLSTPAI